MTERGKIPIDMEGTVKITSANFVTLSQVLSRIGGFKAIIMSIFSIFGARFFNMFVTKFALYVKRKESLQESVSSIRARIV